MANETYKIEIGNGKNNTYKYRTQLRKNGFKWDGIHWTKDSTYEQEILHWEDWCRLRGLKMKAVGESSSRSSDYRKVFFEKNSPIFGSRYACAYCGRKLRREQVQVDHIIPVEMAKRRSDIRRKIQIYGWKSINDSENLCAACSVCNSLKSSKGGLWIIRGRIGKKKSWQYIMLGIKILFAVILGACIGIVLQSVFLGLIIAVLLTSFFWFM